MALAADGWGMADAGERGGAEHRERDTRSFRVGVVSLALSLVKCEETPQPLRLARSAFEVFSSSCQGREGFTWTHMDHGQVCHLPVLDCQVSSGVDIRCGVRGRAGARPGVVFL